MSLLWLHIILESNVQLPYLIPSHAAVWRSISATSRVGSHTSLPLVVRRTRLTASISPWISISSHARQTVPLGHLMNFLKCILCLTCLMMEHWWTSTHFCRQQYTTLMWEKWRSHPEFETWEPDCLTSPYRSHSVSKRLKQCWPVSCVRNYIPAVSSWFHI